MVNSLKIYTNSRAYNLYNSKILKTFPKLSFKANIEPFVLKNALEIKDLEHERLFCYEPTGQIALQKEGSWSPSLLTEHVDVTEEEYRSAFPGNIILHNHPNEVKLMAKKEDDIIFDGGSFSVGDIRAFISHGASKAYVIDRSNLYCMEFPRYDKERVPGIIKKVNEVFKELHPLHYANDPHPHEKHLACEKLNGIFDWKYTVTPISELQK